jgi:GTP cyclohydrolase I
MYLQLDLDDQEFRAAMALRRRRMPEEQMRQFEGYVAAIVTVFGLDLHMSATEDTPRRFLHALLDSTEGYEGDTKLLTACESK